MFDVLFASLHWLVMRAPFGTALVNSLHDQLQDLHERTTGDWHHMHLPEREPGCACTLFGGADLCELHA